MRRGNGLTALEYFVCKVQSKESGCVLIFVFTFGAGGGTATLLIERNYK